MSRSPQKRFHRPRDHYGGLAAGRHRDHDAARMITARTASRTLTPPGLRAHTGDRSILRIAERRVNQGGEPGHDDYGLPPVDIEIPDDARELYRDVQAYHRELRALRRHERSVRWRAPFRRSGVTVPLLAGCLIAALLAVMISAMFTQNPYFNGASAGRHSRPPAGSTGAGRSARAGPSANPNASPSSSRSSQALLARGHLPGKTINVAGKQLPLRTVISAALAIVPANCDCKTAIGQLIEQAESAGVVVYLVGPRGSKVVDLDRLVTPAARKARSTRVATDYQNVLTSAYPTAGLTVLLVDSHGLVTVASRLGPNLMLTKQLQMLRR